ncbi:beta-ketoacyl-[acyl-carrier-protein] synthase family protein [Chryseobacterium sp. MYb264]|uniref:beta-ketoacyl-[acyl-carrier-protein] synthase family protein n=1 Tax=Chryseobacterium sp. MYb264 TaxID=2745153 RepID=UPI002E136000|nr:beta-ketoacyl-[acyl-carrier-protein] synthase family protein [Chryseobacterium sp. MYb264]
MNTSEVKEKIVISGLGVYCSIGKNVDELVESLSESKLGFDYVDEFHTEGYRNTHAGVIKDIENIDSLTGLRSSLILKPSVYQAIEDSGIFDTEVDRSRISISVGTSLTGYGGFVTCLFERHYEEKNERYESSLNEHMKVNYLESINNIPGTLLATEIALEYDISGMLSSSITACSASGNAMAIAVDTIRNGLADVVIVGAVDPLSELTYMGFHTLRAMSPGQPKPLDKNREGLLIGEGSGCIIIESESHARARGAKIYAEIAGYGLSNDAYHATQPHPEGEGGVLAMKIALDEADLSSGEIQYINMHGTGTKHNDQAELKAVERVFGDRLKQIPISSSKSMIGHTLGAAGCIEAVICILALHHNFLPPSLNFETPIDHFDYQVVTAAKSRELNVVMNNSFGFGGNGASFIFKK